MCVVGECVMPNMYLHFMVFPPTALVPAAGDAATLVAEVVAAFFANNLLIGSVEIFAKLGVSQRLNPNLSGSNALVMAYAVATLALFVSIPPSHGFGHSRNHSLNQQPHTVLTPRPPLRKPFSVLLILETLSIGIPDPALTSEISSKLLNPLFDPVTFRENWRQPVKLVKCECETEERHNGCELMEDQESCYVRDRCIAKRRDVACQKTWKTGFEPRDAGVFRGFG